MDRFAAVGCKQSGAFAHTVSYTHIVRKFQVLEANLGSAPVNHQDTGQKPKKLYHP